MMLSSLIDVATVKPAVEVADIFRLYFDDYLKAYHCTPAEFAAVNAIIACRTAAAGGFIRQCDQCGKFQISYCSCGNRNCPKCGAFAKAQWLAQQEARLLPVPHFQVVFTLDHLLNDLAYVNPKAIYDLLFTTANGVLKEFAQRYLDGKVGVTAVLHTWGQTVQHHIHLHCMVTGGALVSTADGYRWQVVSPGFLFPAVELSAAFRDAFCQGLRRLARRGELRLVGSCADLDLEMLIQTMERKAWELFVGKPPKDAQRVDLLGYFSRYVYRTVITNQRLLKVAEGKVTFEYYDNQEKAVMPNGQAKAKRKRCPSLLSNLSDVSCDMSCLLVTTEYVTLACMRAASCKDRQYGCSWAPRLTLSRQRHQSWRWAHGSPRWGWQMSSCVRSVAKAPYTWLLTLPPCVCGTSGCCSG